LLPMGGICGRMVAHGGIPAGRAGIGLVLDAQLKVLSINGDGLASRFEVGDKITGVDGRLVDGMSVDKLARLISGDEGTQVEIAVSRALSFSVTRKKAPSGVSQRTSEGGQVGKTGAAIEKESMGDAVVGGEDDELDEDELSDLRGLWERAGINGALTESFMISGDERLQVTAFLLSRGVEAEDLGAKLSNKGEGMQMEEFGRWLREAKELGTKKAFLEQIDLHQLLASKLPAGNQLDSLAGLKLLSSTEAVQVCQKAAEEMAKELQRLLEDLKQQLSESLLDSEGGNSKFAVEELDDTLLEAVFGDLADFAKGLQGKLGLPHHDILAAMVLEHTAKPDSHVKFKTPNYLLTTTPADELQVVLNRAKAKVASVGSRRVLFYEDLLTDDDLIKRAGLSKAEIVALILYTGPMYVKYNAALRQFPKAVVEGNEGNLYVNTITAVVSGIMKLSMFSRLPDGKIVYRGMANRRLPSKFMNPDERGVSGGVEMGLMSTTTSLKTALQYTKGGRLPTIFSIRVGGVNMGASLQALSQYPGEEEILFPPLSHLERVGPVRVCYLEGVLVRVIPMAVSANLKSATVEALEERRRDMHLSTADFVCLEVFRDLDALADGPDLLPRLHQDAVACSDAMEMNPLDKEAGLKEYCLELISSCKKEFERFVEGQKREGKEYYNSDEQYRRAVADLLERKATASAKLRLYLQDPNLYAFQIEEMSLVDARREILGQVGGRLGKAKREGDREGARAAASELCKETGRMVEEADEVIGGETALMRAAGKRDAQGVRLLLAAGAHPDRPEGPYTALRVASETRDAECAAALIEGGASVNLAIRDARNRTALHFAAEKGAEEVARVLIDAEADVAAVDEGGYTALHWASIGGHAEVARVLIDAKADVGAVAKDGATALHAASVGGHAEFARVLIDAKADVHGVSTNVSLKGTALAIAKLGGHAEVAELLRAAGARDDE